jgi:cell division septal protein FtsQ
MVAKDYQRKNLKNPFFRKKKIKKRKKILFFIFIFLLFITLIVYLLFYSSIFSLKSVKIEEVERIDKNLLEDLVWQEVSNNQFFNIDNQNLFFLPINKLKNSFLSKFDLAEVIIKKKYPNKLEIIAIERQPAFILKNKENYQYRDKQACPINNILVSEDDLKIRAILEDNSLNDENLENCLPLNSDYLADMLDLFNISQNYSLFSLSKFILNGDIHTFTAILGQDVKIFFNRRENFSKQLDKLKALCLEIGEANLNSIEYIDVRYGDKAFINYK